MWLHVCLFLSAVHGSVRWKEYKKKLKETGDRDLVSGGPKIVSQTFSDNLENEK